MGIKDITPGRRNAKLKGARFIESGKGKPGLECSFEFTEPTTDMPETLTWVGWLSDAAIENTMKTVVGVLEYNGSEKVNDQGELTDRAAFNYEKEIQITIEMEERKDAEGNLKLDKNSNPIIDPRIKWVNNIGGSAYTGLTVDKVSSSLKAVGFRAAFLAAQKEHGKPAEKKEQKQKTQETEPPEETTNDELPF
ncbi:hypothetical protein phi1422_0009 [Bdellovibrio phage phi1422]|uniref:hypothetical protein n=1 Tax=Bdellovibrio phage phi1422 TaxID=1127515 RepID=UPI0002536D08|nr:hypothetical protein F395_gp09 [Bdellovibrio phage phi1422]AFC22529.1 hypothetical protein phi1422_0009 [Bdellovibrio phage phi1422]